MIWRFLQAFGASAGLSVGSGVIADIYKLEERGTAMGVFYGVSYCRLVMIDILTLCNS
jgi:MFS family permease